MKLKKIAEILEAEFIPGTGDLETEVDMVCAADLMSDVLAFTKSCSLLLTGLTNPQVVRTAEMADIVGICFARDKKPQAETMELAREKGVPLLSTRFPLYESCGLLYGHGVVGCSEYQGSD